MIQDPNISFDPLLEPCQSIIGSLSGNTPEAIKGRRRNYIKAAKDAGGTNKDIAAKLQISESTVEQIVRQNAFADHGPDLPSTVDNNGGLDPAGQATRMRALWCDVLSADLHDYNADYWRAMARGGQHPGVVLSDLSAYLASRDGQHVQSLAGVTIPAHLAVDLVKLPRKEFRKRFIKESRVDAE